MGWLNATDLHGERRLDDPGDFVRLEVGLALRGDPVVIPVLVGGATMPDEEELPSDLAPLARRNAVNLLDADWRSGLARLVAALRRILEPVAEPEPSPPSPPSPPPDRTRPSALATALGVAGLVVLVSGTWLQLDSWAHPSPNRGDRDGLGFFSGAAPMAILVGAVGGLALSYARGWARIGTGLLLGSRSPGSPAPSARSGSSPTRRSRRPRGMWAAPGSSSRAASSLPRLPESGSQPTAPSPSRDPGRSHSSSCSPARWRSSPEASSHGRAPGVRPFRVEGRHRRFGRWHSQRNR